MHLNTHPQLSKLPLFFQPFPKSLYTIRLKDTFNSVDKCQVVVSEALFTCGSVLYCCNVFGLGECWLGVE